MASILIVEDEVAIRNVLKNILSDENPAWKIDLAEDGEIGIKKIKDNQ